MNSWVERIPKESWIEGAQISMGARRTGKFEAPSEQDLIRMALGPLSEIVDAQPDAVAIDDGAQRLTYAQLWRALQFLAAAIRAVTEPGDMVLALANSNVFFPVMLVGAYLAGRPIVVQDAASPVDRQAFIFEAIASATRVVLVPSNGGIDADYVPAHVPRIHVDLDPASPGAAVSRSLGEHELAGLVFTSGSTGRPKGIAIASRAMAKFIPDTIKDRQLNSDDFVLTLGSPSTGAIGDTLTSFLSGARLRLLDIQKAGLLEAFRVLREERITIFGLVPSVLRTMMKLPGAEQAFATLRVLWVSGEPMSASDLALFRSKLPPQCVINHVLGSMEVGVIFHCHVHDDEVTGADVPVGFVESGRRIVLVDEAGLPAPKGEAGELVVSDDYVALGDWRDGSIDSRRFETDPATGKRVYATGDVLRMRSDGMFEFVGRRDRMVKVLGLRADLGEIESAVRSAPGVADAFVIARQREDTTLVAFVVPLQGAQIDHSGIRRRVVELTAPHMVPSSIHELAEIPRLYNGKADLVRLRSLAESADRERGIRTRLF